MKESGFGEYLVNKGLITREQLNKSLIHQNKSRLLGEIAVEEHYLTARDLSEVIMYMESRPGVMLGEAAISLGYLTAPQLRYLLDVRTRRKIPIGQLLVKSGYLTEEALNREIVGYDSKRRRVHRILVCESTKTVSRLLKMMLTKYGFEVLEAKNGAEALEVARRELPEVLITSNVLGDMEGYELCHTLMSETRTAGIRSILLSSNVTGEEMEKAFEAGANHFLSKPIKEGELVNILYLMEREEEERRPERILIVDDSAGARMVIQQELAPFWENLHIAKNGSEAIQIAKKIRPDIITMDVEMPVMGGLEACKKLKEDPATEDIPVVFITANDTTELREQGFEAGGAEYFTKPFRPRQLADFIAILIESKNIRRKERILVVEDSRTTRHVLKYFFLKNGYNVETAQNGLEALDMIPKVRPDLIITDGHMPKMDGFTLARKLKSMDEWRRLPVIMLTSLGGKADVLKGFGAGASDYILKPFDESELIARVDTHLKNKALLEQLETEKEKLRVANEEKDRFLGIAAHDLRNPLGSIIGYSSILADDTVDDDTRKQFAAIIKDVSEGMLHLLEDLLDITKIESGTVALDAAPWQIADTVRRRVALAEIPAERKNITIHESYPPDITLHFDLHKIWQVIDNLLTNAVKFTKPGKNVFVSVQENGVGVKVEVRDEGVGIPEPEQKLLFTPFSKLSVVPTGGEKSTGLGLSIVSRIVKAHGGEIGVHSVPGVGSTFHFTLPKTAS
ncbi:MAG: response regulator [Nitrospinae bacterium]|nr:response regulator [Nitrospinota bacterium]